MSKSKQTSKLSAADPIYEALKDKIVSGKIAAETPLRQDEIARQHGVSKIPVREALRRLEVDGLVTFRPQRGAVVRKFTDQDVQHLLDIRVALECRALELAIPNMIASDYRDARQLLENYAQATETARWSELNRQFHQMIYEPCSNPELILMISDLQKKLGPFLRLLVTEASGLERPMREHAEILAACEAGDIPKALDALKKHIEATKKEVAAYMRRGA